MTLWQIIVVKLGDIMETNSFIKWLRKWSDWLEWTAFTVFLITDIAIILFIVSSIARVDRLKWELQANSGKPTVEYSHSRDTALRA